MPLGLESCPEPVVECIVQLLDLDDICNLRLTCKSLALGSSHYRFRTFFRSKHIKLMVDALRTFAEGIQDGGLQSLIQHLYLVGIVDECESRKPGRQNYWQNEETRRTQEVNLLSQAFNGLAKYSKNGSPRLLTLRVAIVRNGEETTLPADSGPSVPLQKSVWLRTMHTFDTVVSALAASSLRIDGLNIFSEPDMPCSSLACDQINANEWNDSGFAKTLVTLRPLAISLSTRVFAFPRALQENKQDVGRSSKRDAAEVQAEAEDENDFVGLSRLLRLCNQLGNLEINYLRIPMGYSALVGHFYYETILQRIVELDRLPILKRCKFSGISAKETDLLGFIQRARGRELSLEKVILCTGTFRSTFDYCTSRAASMTKLHFDTLYETLYDRHYVEKTIFFAGGGKSRIGFPSASATERLDREGESVRTSITYYISPRTPIDNPWIPEWGRFRRTENGT
ncbi:hypothetical protein NOF04DRAFT_11421 [Fusarium oxysporum II5]|uniref:F-box domain-containing protein n=3 Tax=Fusarium oxysporum species complex TaxID=171631 RepID=N1SAK8_FUSC4|nr:uncharacterized protein FOIG_12651 [Fusarium odoratissimum NRRL 54006]EMT74302.1 hypothetical protein FOC4_g10002401 [Fusarium odoratissimum]EXL94456.1 hypothetical protein FOIG_12651 [Fusarium odoratissimum NRRL 54006]KAK2122414.1 hypothetical protein NOF04DRAFT_11421 [Fusarium oxysporum II5]TXB97026.1 hypothetical protein FocTR4_00010958 [Fusarium oxysporum f. sp. cubense]